MSCSLEVLGEWVTLLAFGKNLRTTVTFAVDIKEAANEDAGLNMKTLNGRNRGSLRQIAPRLLGAQVDSQPSKSGLGPNSFTPRESTKEALLGNLPRNALLNRLLGKDRKRGSLSECFWKYCV